jgi:lysophospholipase
MLENLNKTVVITGSQIPISELRNDAVDNLLGALLVAGPYLIPEVVIFFGNRLLRGNRATKESSTFI